MNSISRLTPDRIEKRAVEIRELLLNAGIWQDTGLRQGVTELPGYRPPESL